MTKTVTCSISFRHEAEPVASCFGSRMAPLEMRLLAAGVTVTRTAGDLTRYHGKMMIIDRRELWIFTFNYTHLDIERSRSFALVTKQSSVVQEAGETE